MILESKAPASLKSQPSDEELSDLEEYLRCRLGCRVRALQVLFHLNGLILRGRADSWYVKQLAQQMTMEFTAIPILANEIRVN